MDQASQSDQYSGPSPAWGNKPSLPPEIPILPLLTAAFYPNAIGALHIRKPHTRQIFEGSEEGQIVGLVIQKDPQVERAQPQDLCPIGLWGKVLNKLYLPQNITQVILQGGQRIEIVEYVQEEPYLIARVRLLEETEYEDSLEVAGLMAGALHRLESLIALDPNLSHELLNIIQMNLKGPGQLADLIANHVTFPLQDKQRIIEALDGKERLSIAIELLERELMHKQTEAEIQQQVQIQIDKRQREHYLRMQLATIRKELGEQSEQEAEIRELQQKVREKGLPDAARSAAEHEVERLAAVPPASVEYGVIHTYLDWILSLPWQESTQDNLDLKKAAQILDRDHYGLERVKERILEFLAVRKLKKDLKGPILCFVGPPGVGKTSLGRSIANALGRKFLRVSLGGVRDEAEIRGHRRTYVGSMPGKIIQELRRAGSNNPLFMIDEIDKLSTDFRGDPYAALLEVLDPEQNRDFVDHYLDLPFDLSRIMFVTTANVLYAIPSPVLDRLEVIELSGYIEEEKLEIARRYLLPKQLEENGLQPKHLDLTDGAILRIIRHYTRELGLRNLERNIATVCRKVAKGVAMHRKQGHRVDAEEILLHLGPVRYVPVVAERRDEVGVATGLAWTPAGGEILFVEALKTKGHGRIQLTGKLGDVMRESAQAALSYVKAQAQSLEIPEDCFDRVDIHIHLPEGAIPKDGPSAGVVLAVAIASLMSERPVRHEVAMTGEITLRGKVLAVGGVKEKVLAARAAGISTVILPTSNEKDLAEIPVNIRDEIRFIFVDSVQQVFEHAIYQSPAPRAFEEDVISPGMAYPSEVLL